MLRGSMLRGLMRYRQLIASLAGREIKARYRGSFLGFFWSLLNPLLLLGVYTFVFTYVFPPRGDTRPYPLFLLAGLLPWTWLSATLLESSVTLVANASIIKRVIFPAEVLPVVTALANLTHLLLALPIVVAAALWAHAGGPMALGASLLALPVVMGLQLLFITGLSLAISALAVHFRDLRDLLANALNLWFFLTPIIYPLEALPHPALRRLLQFNPATPFIVSYQRIFFSGDWPLPRDLACMTAFAAASWIIGAAIFERLRDALAEEV